MPSKTQLNVQSGQIQVGLGQGRDTPTVTRAQSSETGPRQSGHPAITNGDTGQMLHDSLTLGFAIIPILWFNVRIEPRTSFAEAYRSNVTEPARLPTAKIEPSISGEGDMPKSA